MLKSLSGRFLILTIAFVMLAEVLIFVPSIARYREDFLLARIERAQLASLALLADGSVDPDLEEELLQNAGVYNVVLRRDEARQLVLSSPIPMPVTTTYDLRMATPAELLNDAVMTLLETEPTVIRVIGYPTQRAGMLIEVTIPSQPLRDSMIQYGLRILVLSAVISVITAALLFLAVRYFIVTPMKRVVHQMARYANAPEDARNIIVPSNNVTELREAEEALKALETELTNALRQKERLAQLGGAVARVSHDLRNILTSAQLFADRLETVDDPTVARMAPKLVRSISRAVTLTESTLAFGKAEEPPPSLSRVSLADVVNDVLDSERLAIGDADISLSADVPAGCMIRADSEQLHRVLTNLVRNARQAIAASGKGGEIGILFTDEDACWRILVRDTGPGLPMKAREHLFQPFSGSSRRGGTGLGLAISAELLRGHGGTLKLLESTSEGTAFEIWLPKGDAEVSL
ncbi:MAG: HAMP domain-containing sensor histidine kinase [Pseudomonadota bacterium]|nr:HAMP domain-containing sensor histidine kinase [Pseudomonadota bacterium]